MVDNKNDEAKNNKGRIKQFLCKNWISILSLAISIMVLLVSFPTETKISFDYMGGIVGILSFLVAIILGWNIYSAVDIKEEWKNLNQKIVKDRIDIENNINNNKYLTEAYINYMQAEGYLGSGRYVLAYREYIMSIYHFYHSWHKNMYLMVIDKIRMCARYMYAEVKAKGYVLDWDIYDDFKFGEFYSNLQDILDSKVFDNISEVERCMMNSIKQTDVAEYGCYKFQLYRKDVELKKRPNNVIYGIFSINGDYLSHEKRIYTKYEEFMKYIMGDILSYYDFFGICELDIKQIPNESLEELKNVTQFKHITWPSVHGGK